MKLSNNKHDLFLLIGLLSVFIISGCASFAGKELPIYSKEQLQIPEKKISATYEVKALSHIANSTRTIEDNSTALYINNRVKDILSKNPAFSNLPEGQADYHCSFILRREVDPLSKALVSSIVAGITYTIVPTRLRQTYIITVQVKHQGQVVKTYTYKDHMDTWTQLFLVFLTPFKWPDSISNSVIDNMIMNFAYDFNTDMQSQFQAFVPQSELQAN